MIQITSASGIDETFPDYIFSTSRVRFVDATYVKIDDVMYVRASIVKLKSNSQDVATSGGGSSQPVTDLPFDGNRPVKRAGLPLINPAATSVKTFLEKYFYPFVNATIALRGSDATYEYGTVAKNITISASVTANDEKVITNLRLIEITNGNNIISVGDNNELSVVLPSVTPNEVSLISKSRIYKAVVDVGGNGLPTTLQTGIRTIYFEMPTFYGVSASILTGARFADFLFKSLYSVSTRNMSVPFNGTDKYLYFATPFPLGTPIIKDNNGFDVTGSFIREVIEVTTDQSFPRWKHNYYVWRTIVPTTVLGKTFTITFP